MFEEKRLLFLYAETPLHVGAGKGAGAVDLPIQRERNTDYPQVQSSGLKGSLRDIYRDQKHNGKDDHADVLAIFGKAGTSGENYAGAIAPGDARLLLFPVRSLAGVFAWITSRHALANFVRAAALAAQSIGWALPDNPGNEKVLVTPSTILKAGEDVILEEFSYTPQESAELETIAEWLAENALPSGYDYWKTSLPQRICLLPEDDFRDFCVHATEIQTHVKLDADTKTALNTGLWTTESLPVDSMLYAPLMATAERKGDDPRSASQVLDEIASLDLQHMQLGGDETTGQGWVGLRFFPEVQA